MTGDGIHDYVFGAGPGHGSRVALVARATGTTLQEFGAFEPTFTGGVFLALADLDGDGWADLIVSPDVGGGPRVRMLRAADLAVLADFFGIEDPDFRGEAQVAGGDVNSDGRADLIVAAGYLGGTRVAGWNGAALAQGIPERVFSDFFAFESTLRTGLYITAGDIDDDGRADLIVGGGQVAGPRVTIFSGAQLASSNEPVELANFFANDPAARSEVRVGVKELNGNGRVDVTAGLSGVVRSHVIDPLAATATPDPF